MSTAIVWLRQDLRLNDNQALKVACDNHNKIIVLYIYDTELNLIGEAQKWWLHHSLDRLINSFHQRHHQLNLKKGSPLEVLKKLINSYDVTDIYWNRCYEPEAIKRDKEIKSHFKEQGLSVHSYSGNLLNEPWEVQTQNQEYYKVFTSYWKQCLKQMQVRELLSIEQWPETIDIKGDKLENWSLLPQKPNWAKRFPDYWQPGEKGAEDKLDDFLQDHISHYKTQRDFPAEQATSKLSPHLHFGEISVQQIWHEVNHLIKHGNINTSSAESFLSEIGWREFSYHLLYHFPKLPSENFRPEFSRFPWHQDKNALEDWQKGLTGFPIVDAGMRELWQTGYMHNRVRMIVASFLTKDLFIDWREGAEWFLYTLVDADMASNSAGWQWVAGSGADAAPYFRIFNPILQGERFDKKGEYIKKWVPELAEVDKKWIHKPWQAAESELPIKLGKDYPKPLVDHREARQQALDYYDRIKKKT